jgi:hypothetical protein
MVHTPIHIIHPRIIDMKVKMHAYSSKLYSHIHHRSSIFTTIWTVRGKSFVSRASCGFRIFFRRSRSKGWGSVSSWGDSLTLSTATTTRSHTAPLRTLVRKRVRSDLKPCLGIENVAGPHTGDTAARHGFGYARIKNTVMSLRIRGCYG